MSNQGNGTVLPVGNGETRQTGMTGHVNVGGTVYQGTNMPGGKVMTPDGKIHG